jgi:chromosome segregation ATPase
MVGSGDADIAVLSPESTKFMDQTNMSASSSVAADPSNRAIGDVSPEIQAVQEAIAEVERQIRSVEEKINKVEEKLETQLSDKMFDHWSVKEKQLRAEKEQLRAEKEQLRIKEERLATSKNPLVQKPGTFCDCFFWGVGIDFDIFVSILKRPRHLEAAW